MPKIYIHCGLHKTGTTALQLALDHHRDSLIERGLYYPRTGIPYGLWGQHNIAWRVARDRRFHPDHGDVNALLQEIRGRRETVLISSEDFEGSLVRIERWAPLLKAFRSIGFEPELIVYNRNPGDYLVSLYFELVRTGFGEEFQGFAREILETGTITRLEQTFVLDETRLKAAVNRIEGATVQFRDYDALAGDSIFLDLCEAISANDAVTDLMREVDLRANPRAPLSDLLASFLSNREQVFAMYDQARFFTQNLTNWSGVEAVLPPTLKRAAWLRLRGQEPPAEPEEAGQGAVNVVRLFSFETQQVLREIAGLLASGAESPSARPLAAERAREWRRYISIMD
jgi:hypothetical protein